MKNSINFSTLQSRNNIHVGAWLNFQPNDIMLLISNVNYTEIHLANGQKKLVATTLKILEERFAACGIFFRTHKSFLVNLNFIKRSNIEQYNEFIEMKNDYRVSISRRKKMAFVAKVDQHFYVQPKC